MVVASILLALFVLDDYCVKFSVLDALQDGFQVFVVKDGCRAVNLNKGDEEKALMEMEQAGARIIFSYEIQKYL